jgi:hypothetical protein
MFSMEQFLEGALLQTWCSLMQLQRDSSEEPVWLTHGHYQKGFLCKGKEQGLPSQEVSWELCFASDPQWSHRAQGSKSGPTLLSQA